MVGKKFDYSRETYRNGCSLAHIFTHLWSVKTHQNALVAFRILPTPSTKISNNLAGLNGYYGLVFQGRFWWKNLRYQSKIKNTPMKSITKQIFLEHNSNTISFHIVLHYNALWITYCEECQIIVTYLFSPNTPDWGGQFSWKCPCTRREGWYYSVRDISSYKLGKREIWRCEDVLVKNSICFYYYSLISCQPSRDFINLWRVIEASYMSSVSTHE